MEIKIYVFFFFFFFFVVGQLQKILKKIAGKLSLKTETLKIFDSISYKTGNNSTSGWNFFHFLNGSEKVLNRCKIANGVKIVQALFFLLLSISSLPDKSFLRLTIVLYQAIQSHIYLTTQRASY